MSVQTAGSITNEAGRQGTFGPLLKNGKSLFSVVAYYCLQDQGVVLDASGEVIATAVDKYRQLIEDNGPRNIVDILRPVEIKKQVPAKVGRGQLFFTRLADPADYVGQTIRKASHRGHTSGIISALDAPFHMLDSLTDSVRKFEGAFEVKSFPGEEPFARKGDAGSPIYAADGALLGVLVGVAGDTFYAVPSEKLAERFNLYPARLEDLLNHNRRAFAIEIERPEVNKNTVHAFYGLSGIASAEKTLNRRDLVQMKVNPKQGLTPPEMAAVYREHLNAKRFAPMVPAKNFVGQRDVAVVLQAIASNQVAPARFNFVTGIDMVLKHHAFTRNELVDRIHTFAAGSRLERAEDVVNVCLRFFDETEYARLIKGRSVSAPTAWLALRAMQDIETVRESGAWSRLLVEPAIFVAKESASSLRREFDEHNRRRKSFDSVFQVIAGQVDDHFPLYSGSKVVEAIAAGLPVRFRTAWLADRAAQIFGNVGFNWKRTFFGLNKHAPVEEAITQNMVTAVGPRVSPRRNSLSRR